MLYLCRMIDKYIFQYYPGDIRSTVTLGKLRLSTFVEKTKNPKDEVKERLKKLKNLQGEEKSNLKKTLFYFTPSVIINGVRSYDNIVKFTGLLVLDFDKIKNAEKFRDMLFDRYNFIYCAYVSPSGNGVKAICRMPVVETIGEYKEYFYGMADIMEQYDGFDMSNQNPVLPLFSSYDPDILIREEAEEFNTKGEKPTEFKIDEVIEPLDNVLITQREKDVVVKIITKGIEKITDNGHPQVRNISLMTGGYVMSGYISDYDASTLLERLITQNSYLSKDTKGYIRTSRQFIEKGKNRPLYLRD